MSGPISSSASRSAQVLSGLPHLLLVLQADRRLVFATPSAARLFADGRARQMAQRLMSLGQLEANKLEDLLRLAAAGNPSQVGLWFTPGLQTGELNVSPLASGIAHGADWPEGCLLLMVHLDQPGLTQRARIEALCRQCRLTPTERYVLMLLADGQAVEAAAHQLQLRVSTLRTHIRNMLGKTRAPSLMQLLRWLGSGAPLFG